jgi:hypothetical protein
MKRTSRSEFSEKTRKIIAGRAGYRCSFPGCGRVTIGPGVKSDQIESTGVAAHIFPASPRGPRNVSGLCESERNSPENGIWLCAEHGRLVDPNDGEKYPAVLLQNYKALHESNIAREKGGVFSRLGWFQELTLHESPIFPKKIKLRFGKVTLLIGGNFAGKTALSEWLASIGDPSILSFWMRPDSPIRLDVEVVYFNPAQQSARLQIGTDGSVTYFSQQKEFPFQPSPLRFVMVREPGRLLRNVNVSELDDIQLICSELNVDALTVRSLFPYVDKLGSGSVRNLRIEKGEEKLEVKADLEGTRAGLSYRALSHSGQTRILVELAITMARFSAEHIPALLLLEGLWRFDSSWFQRYCDYLSEANRLFQTVIILPEERYDISRLRWSGWVTARLESTHDGKVINQDSF